MPTPPSHKLGAPQFEDTLRREALLHQFDASTRQHRLTWVVGLPGAGKSSLVARWLAESRLPAVWYRLDESDGDVAGLFSAMALSLGQSLRLPEWSPEHQADLPDFASRFFAEAGREPLCLVLDDCHRIPDDSPTLLMLEQLHPLSANRLKVVAISRRPPPAALDRGRMGGWLGVIDGLRLSEAEARTLAETRSGRPLSAAEVRALAAADGWLAHVLAIVRGAPVDSLPTSSPTSQQVGNFLAAELLAALPASHRAGLRRLAELPEVPQWTGMAMLGETTLGPEVERLLRGLARRCYFVDDTGRGHWRLHDLLRDALRERNRLEDGLGQLRQVRCELGKWVEHGMPEVAMTLFVDAADVAGAARLIARHGEAWLTRGLHRTVFDWLTRLRIAPEDRSRPMLELWRAHALLPLEPEATRPLFAATRAAAVSAADARTAYNAWCGEVQSYVVQWGAVQGLAKLVDDLESLHAALGPPTGDLDFRTSADALTALMYGQAEDRRIGHYAKATARAIAHAPDAATRITAAAQLLIYRLWWAGDYPAGRALYEAFDAEVDSDETLPPLPRLVWWSCASIIDWQCGDPLVCYAKVDRGLALAKSSGVHVRDFFLLTQGIFCALSQSDLERAERYLAQLARTERTHRRLDTMVFHFFRSWYNLSRGDAATALAHAQTAWPLAEAMGSMFHKVIVLSALSPARLHCGDVEGAKLAYREQLALAKAADNPTFSFIAFCSGAEIALKTGDAVSLGRQIERMLRVKELGGFHSGCGWRTSVMRELLAFALNHDILPEVARRWIREKQISPPTPAPLGWPMRVRILALDGLAVRLDSVATEATAAKAPAKLRELLAALVAAREGASHADLAEWLWPDAEGDRAAASLKVAIHRLRLWLGTEAVRVQNGRVALDPAYVGCDVWETLDGNAGGATIDPDRLLYGFDSLPIASLRQRWRRAVKWELHTQARVP